MIYVTEVNMSPGGTKHEHIQNVRWFDSTDSARAIKESSVANMVTFLEGNGRAQVQGPPAVDIGVNKTDAGRKYIQTYADKSWTNNLLSLPRY